MSQELQDNIDAIREQAKSQGLLLIISGPSGVGKTTITTQVVKKLEAAFSVSMTTRPMTHEDVDGRDYHFVSEEQFRQAVASGDLLEWAEVFGNLYGTPRGAVVKQLNEGKIVILEIDVEGAILVKQNMPEAFALFVLPPSEEELLGRLRKRQRESEEIILRRFAKSKAEIERAKASSVYDCFLTNDILEHTIQEAVRVVESERMRRVIAE
ncbi:Guanylate kinase [Poriferisphaera corsica]|uniref:Guanylate kinase n=1 Tax=Poriferisphaera corsica TaxID=2528020 RepID=A0A517YTF0_9BACT|nr:guanylate kinase [Poriferisphaera corsica]QDU33517.1 Guanylate kinase [Poriferisphaera corsica]